MERKQPFLAGKHELHKLNGKGGYRVCTSSQMDRPTKYGVSSESWAPPVAWRRVKAHTLGGPLGVAKTPYSKWGNGRKKRRPGWLPMPNKNSQGSNYVSSCPRTTFPSLLAQHSEEDHDSFVNNLSWSGCGFCFGEDPRPSVTSQPSSTPAGPLVSCCKTGSKSNILKTYAFSCIYH